MLRNSEQIHSLTDEHDERVGIKRISVGVHQKICVWQLGPGVGNKASNPSVQQRFSIETWVNLSCVAKVSQFVDKSAVGLLIKMSLRSRSDRDGTIGAPSIAL